MWINLLEQPEHNLSEVVQQAMMIGGNAPPLNGFQVFEIFDLFIILEKRTKYINTSHQNNRFLQHSKFATAVGPLIINFNILPFKNQNILEILVVFCMHQDLHYVI